MLEKAICAECGNVHASRACPLCGCRNREPISDATKLALAHLSQQAATLADALETAKNQLEAVRKAGFRASSITIAQHKAESALAAYKESK